MTEKRKAYKKERKAAVKKWSDTPAENPRYEGATPSEVGRALLGKHARKGNNEDDHSVKPDV